MNGVVDLSQCFRNAATSHSPRFYLNSMNAAQWTTTTEETNDQKKKKLQLDENLQRMHSTWIEFSFDPSTSAAPQWWKTRKLKFKSCSNPFFFPSHLSLPATSIAFIFGFFVVWFLWPAQAALRRGGSLNSQVAQICNCLSAFRQHHESLAATVFRILIHSIFLFWAIRWRCFGARSLAHP